MMMRAVSLPMHSGVIRDLSVAQKNLIGLERQAFGITDNGKQDEEPIRGITIIGVSPGGANV